MKNIILLLITLFFYPPLVASATNIFEAFEPSNQWLTYQGKNNMPNIVLIAGDEEYRSEEAMPQLAKILNERFGFNCTVLFAQDPSNPGFVNPNYQNNIPGLAFLKTADLVIMLIRFRALPDAQMTFVDDYLKSGKPIVALRTSTHAFRFDQTNFKSSFSYYDCFNQLDNTWNGGFGRLVLGETWISHHGSHGNQSTKGVIASGREDHPILTGLTSGDIWGATDVYTVRTPLPKDGQTLIYGQVIEREGPENKADPLLGMSPFDFRAAGIVERKNEKGENVEIDLNNPMMPVAWTKSYMIPGGKEGKTFTTTLGASVDLLSEGVRKMIINAAFWCLDLPITENANVDLVGAYNPTGFAFHEDAYWIELKTEISKLKD
jgi:hypothetical protein